MKHLRSIIPLVALLGLWQAVVWVTGAPPYILPSPWRVGIAWLARSDVILGHAVQTCVEILLGLLLGTSLGMLSSLVIAYCQPARRWLMPVLVVSQAIPVFALAPMLVLWFGYGIGSKVAMATLIIYFPVTTAFLDGLRRTEPGWIDLAQTMDASRWAVLRHIRIPAALPALASGLRVATAVAPIGAVVGEWVGSSAGLGYLMLHANARMQIDLMFASLATLAALSITLYFTVDKLLRRALPWVADSTPTED